MQQSISKRRVSFSPTDNDYSTTSNSTTIFDDETIIYSSLEGFESRFETLDDFLQYSPRSTTSSSINSQVEQDEHHPASNTNVKEKTAKSRKSKSKKLKTKLKNFLKVKKKKKLRQTRRHSTVLRTIFNGATLIFRVVLFVIGNVLIFTLILGIL